LPTATVLPVRGISEQEGTKNARGVRGGETEMGEALRDSHTRTSKYLFPGGRR
jgi:hypothetical protein